MTLKTLDELAKPATGRYFPASVADLVASIRMHKFAVHDYHERLPLLMENCQSLSDRGYQVASFLPMSYLAVFSLPNHVPKMLGGRALGVIVEQFGVIDKTPRVAVREQQFDVFVNS